MMEVNGFLISDWTISGLETCITVKKPDIGLSVVFDLGYSTKAAVNCRNVFITHGHPDHISAITQHANKRHLAGLPPATYYMMPHLVDNVRTLLKISEAMMNAEGMFDAVSLSPVSVGDEIQLPNAVSARPFPTTHSIPSQGYIVYKRMDKLNEDYKGLSHMEISKLVRAGVQVKDSTVTPQVAFTGDTSFDIFLSPPTEDLLKVPLLIMEMTYINDDDGVDKAISLGHTHYQQLLDNAHLFTHVGAILLIHFSDKYPPSYVRKHINETLPEFLKDKVHLALTAKTMSP